MKKAILTIGGFTGYSINENNQIANIETCEMFEANKSGKVKLNATEDNEDNNVVKGQQATLLLGDILSAIPDENWIEEETNIEKEVKEVDAEKEARKKLLADLNKEKKSLFDKILASSDVDIIMECKAKMNEIDSKIAEIKPVAKTKVEFVPTEEEKVAIELYESLQQEIEDAKGQIKACKLEIEKITLPAGYKKAKTGDSEVVPQRAPKLSYEIAQEIRKGLSEGIEPKVLSEQFGTSLQSIGYIKNYLQHKLRKGDTAYTPLINDFYPSIDSEFNQTGTDGAPYVEDKISENSARYIIAANRKENSVTKK